MEILGIAASLALLIYFAYRGYSVIFFAPIFALLAALTQGLPVMPTYTEIFMVKAAIYVKNFFPVFMLGAVFGKIMEESGMAKSIAHALIQSLGPRRAILSAVLSAAILTYGGVSMFVVVFAVYPFAAALFREANIPKKLVPASIVLGAFTFTMDSLPGSPQIQNIIPTKFLGTTIYAGPYLGTFIAIVMFATGMLWLTHRAKTAYKKGEGYGDHTLNEPTANTSKLPSWQISLLPLLAVLVINYLGNKVVDWNPAVLNPIIDMKLPLAATSVKTVISTWSLIIAVAVGIVIAGSVGIFTMSKGSMSKAISAGAVGSLLAIMNVASEVGYGNVISALPGFKSIIASIMAMKIGGDNPLASMAVTINIICGITGSASGGVSIALDLFSKMWLDWANAVHMSPEILHRFASIASGGFDTGPHNGAVITLLAVCGLTHKQAYPDIFAITILKILMVVIALIFVSVFGFA
ncbi:GntP family permease [Burkholderia cenocepacia]|uniref:GntP family permease n=1 Tax=Burkholderia cenocepacia TaxID=95486 RepID=UPI0004F7AF0E|nr:GntP family permease [Burkholderia cenocepacia]AIO43335.1 citrate transporter family protein [Burkholderia cepacia]MCG0577982.1 GntP family permease [Burkholderia cenocepacia]MCW3524440.1 GntP family permease [Burkholderia cenocepacia]MCW3614662.1 GntP family permease [Burkholderia cenocepacia]MCW3652600.1 GntP family permease [Burkholderia cenocepacia]